MIHKPKDELDYKAMSKKYRTNVKRIISAWKKGYSDMEISQNLGIEMFTLQQIKTDIELSHRRMRLEKKRKAIAEKDQAPREHHIFFNPFI